MAISRSQMAQQIMKPGGKKNGKVVRKRQSRRKKKV
jgi:hypothetical protein